MLTTETLHNYSFEEHDKHLKENPVLLYMKGTPREPLCGFSKLAVHILQQCGTLFTFINVLDPDIRSPLKKISEWPTFPQLYIRGKFIGGSDIIADLYAKGELQKKLHEHD